jgi:hypothetical protein
MHLAVVGELTESLIAYVQAAARVRLGLAGRLHLALVRVARLPTQQAAARQKHILRLECLQRLHVPAALALAEQGPGFGGWIIAWRRHALGIRHLLARDGNKGTVTTVSMSIKG